MDHTIPTETEVCEALEPPSATQTDEHANAQDTSEIILQTTTQVEDQVLPQTAAPPASQLLEETIVGQAEQAEPEELGHFVDTQAPPDAIHTDDVSAALPEPPDTHDVPSPGTEQPTGVADNAEMSVIAEDAALALHPVVTPDDAAQVPDLISVPDDAALALDLISVPDDAAQVPDLISVPDDAAQVPDLISVPDDVEQTLDLVVPPEETEQVQDSIVSIEEDIQAIANIREQCAEVVYTEATEAALENSVEVDNLAPTIEIFADTKIVPDEDNATSEAVTIAVDALDTAQVDSTSTTAEIAIDPPHADEVSTETTTTAEVATVALDEAVAPLAIAENGLDDDTVVIAKIAPHKQEITHINDEEAQPAPTTMLATPDIDIQITSGADIADAEQLEVSSLDTEKLPDTPEISSLDAEKLPDTPEVSSQELAHTLEVVAEEPSTKPVALAPEATAAPITEENASTQHEQESEAKPTPTLGVLQRTTRQLSALPWRPAMRGLVAHGRARAARIKRAIPRPGTRQGKQPKSRRWLKIMSAAIIASILVGLATPLCVALIGYSTYSNIKGVATDGVNHLLAVKALIPANKSDLTSVLNPQKLANADTELGKAQNDFLQLQDMVNRPDIQSLLQQYAPQYSDKLDMARHLVQVALDVSRMGQEFIGVAQWGTNALHGPLISSGSDTPLVGVDNINTIEAALIHGQYYINDIQTQMAQVDLAQVPLGSPAQKAQLSKALDALPQALGLITQAQSLLGPVSWLLGVGQQRHFLVQTLDRGELRPSGGFEGQYGVLTLQDGRMSPFSLRDIAELDYNGSGNELGNHPPAQYKWMDFGNFGVRDANLSADYPTDARLIMQLFQQEGGGPVDGDIQITPVVIEQLLDITGPLYVQDYNETITAQNLEDKIHLYQQNFTYIGKEKQVTGTNTHDTRKAFTSELGQLLLDRVKHLQVKQFMDLGKVLLTDLKSRDLQVYFTDPVAEQWLVQNDDSGAMPQFTNGTDGFMVVQANISISKAAQFVHSTFTDHVSLDAQGGAYHHLTITLNYQQTGPVYGFNSYADYLRVYAPANARLLSAYGFNTGATLCTPLHSKPPVTSNPPNPNPNPDPNPPSGPTDPTGSYTDAGLAIYGCGEFYHSYPDEANRDCPNNNYQLGYDGMQGRAWPVQLLGGPSAKSSDLPGYAMWGGMTLTPKNCISTITLSWYVPNVVQHTPGQAPYQLMVGHQAGWPVTAQVSIDTSALPGVQSLAYNQTIDVDTLVALPALPMPPTKKPTAPTPSVTPTGTTKRP